MHYERQELGFSFDLPDGWWRDEHNLTLSFHGPNGGIGIRSELVQIKIGTVLPSYVSPANREQFLAEPGAQVSRTLVGDEDNAVELRRALDSEISVVRAGVHYTILHFHDPVTVAAIDCLKRTTRFGSEDSAQAAIRRWSEPSAQAVGKVLRASSPEEARDILAGAGMPAVRVTGGTFHNISERSAESAEPEANGFMPVVALLTILALAGIGWYFFW